MLGDGTIAGYSWLPRMKRGLRATSLLLATVLLATIAGCPAWSDDQALTFKGMTINIDVGFGPGGVDDCGQERDFRGRRREAPNGLHIIDGV
jgi:hypothetical protein